ncbi:ABC transporter permease [Bifidobacterium actinocoloniiforme DSM 22766]|uniref:ABC transporter permease n=1 Tax=Bifidobacterium actinocoloniiforme DSM 22766 TaxID=1437605 RepID=A0A086YYG4_9BIFI|nr:ABC transporter permease [Bifidobacterium actinocoloniiforme]AKV55864.1 hypothetical protein AB656_06555 [Bifidobacterium actinocoloniiforme DSM 22766]KFI39314.1 ABC transporter permease [Bifidobacterium actinocoloniiforme DSM 22766]
MFVLKNAWRAITRNKARNATFLIVCIAVTASAVVGLTVLQADEDTRTTIYDTQATDAVITPKTDGQGKGKTAKPLTWEQYSQYAQLLQANSIQFGAYYYETAPASFQGIKPVGGQGEMNLVGLSDSTVAAKGPYGKINRVQGKDLDYSESAGDAVLVSQPLAEANRLKTGSVIKIADPANAGKTVDMSVSGIYEVTGAQAKGPAANAVYAAYATFAQHGFDKAGQPGDKGRDLVVGFRLQNPDALKRFTDTLHKAGLSAKQYDVSSPSLEAYQRSVQPLHDRSGKIRALLIAILVFGAVLALVWLIFGLMFRANELGVAITIGVSKARIGWQMALETLIVTLPGLLIGLGAGTALCPAAVRSAITLPGIQQMPAAALWRVCGSGLAICFIIALLAWVYAGTFRTSRLYQPIAVSQAPGAPQTDAADAKETA